MKNKIDILFGILTWIIAASVPVSAEILHFPILYIDVRLYVVPPIWLASLFLAFYFRKRPARRLWWVWLSAPLALYSWLGGSASYRALGDRRLCALTWFVSQIDLGDGPVGVMKKRILLIGGGILLALGLYVFSELRPLFIDPYGGRPHKIAIVGPASFSPTQDLIAISFSGLKLKGIFLINGAGKVVRWLDADTENWSCGDPVFSPDGEKIAFCGGRPNGYFSIYVMNKYGGNVRRLTFAKAYDFDPVFSPDGRGIYFIRHLSVGRVEGATFLKGDIYYVDLISGLERQKTNYKLTALRNLSILPDGRHAVIWSESLGKEGNTCWKIDLENPARKWPIAPDFSPYAKTPWERFSQEPHRYIDLRYPVLSADGRCMAFSWANPETPENSKDYQPQLYVMDMHTMKPRKLTQNWEHGVRAFAFAPDGQRIIFDGVGATLDFGKRVVFKKSNLWLINRDGTGLRNFSLDFSAVADSPPARK